MHRYLSTRARVQAVSIDAERMGTARTRILMPSVDWRSRQEPMASANSREVKLFWSQSDIGVIRMVLHMLSRGRLHDGQLVAS